jgi:hypothetical protein
MLRDELIERLKAGEVQHYQYCWAASGPILPKLYEVETLYNEKGIAVSSRNKVILESTLYFTKYYLTKLVFNGIAISNNTVSAIKRDIIYNYDSEHGTERLELVKITDDFLLSFKSSYQGALERLLTEHPYSKLIIKASDDCIYVLEGDATRSQLKELVSALKVSVVKYDVIKSFIEVEAINEAKS